MAGSLLGDLGADVIKVESFPRASLTRQARVPPVNEYPAYEISPIHHLANRNKRNIALNLRSEGGDEAFVRLLEWADVFFEGYSAGTVERLGFGWDRVHAINPRLTMMSLPGWGAEGPYRGYVTLGSGLDAAAGHTALRGHPDRPEADIPPIYHSDATGALTVVFAAVAALKRRRAEGSGSFIDISQIEALAWQLPGAYAEWTMNGRLPERLGNRDPHVVPHGCYLAGGGEAGDDDSWVVIAAEDDRQWSGLAGVAGHPEWALDDHPWSTVPGRLEARSEIDEALGAYAATDTAEAIADAVQAAGAIAAPASAPWSVVSSPQLLHRGWLQDVSHPAVGDRLMPGFLWQTSPEPTTWDRACGLLGEHNDEVLTMLGYSADAIDRLRHEGAVGDRYD
jgi:crotonobetainyl-CoA:carnitine CoA-transferase CaiB-like acyl-CoA transferase